MEPESNKGKGPRPGERHVSRMEDLELESVLQLARGHDADALAELYRRYSRRVFGLCRYLMGSTETAEDATSEVFLKLQRSIDSYDGSVPFPSWLLRVTSNHCIDMLRRKRRERQVIGETEAGTAPLEVAGPEPSPLSEVISAEQQAAIRQAIASLPENYRVPLVLRYYSDLGYDEIAHKLGLKRDHVAVLLLRAKRKLRVVLARGRE
jgi:RNA polymerase sigma-70 factor (ECF subfamily)